MPPRLGPFLTTTPNPRRVGTYLDQKLFLSFFFDIFHLSHISGLDREFLRQFFHCTHHHISTQALGPPIKHSDLVAVRPTVGGPIDEAILVSHTQVPKVPCSFHQTARC